jgi:hypothetical protein
MILLESLTGIIRIPVRTQEWFRRLQIVTGTDEKSSCVSFVEGINILEKANTTVILVLIKGTIFNWFRMRLTMLATLNGWTMCINGSLGRQRI